MKHFTIAFLLGLLGVALSGCVERTIRITSEPPGAIVMLNDVELGRTPVEADFLYHGHYEVQLRLDGYEPLTTTRKASAPFYEYPGPDLVAAALPVQLNNTIEWHFELSPALESTVPSEQLVPGLLERAGAARDELGPADASVEIGTEG